MTRLVFISDTHNRLEDIQIPDGDILIHSGDCSYQGGKTELQKFRKAMAKLTHKHKIFVPGNHEITLDKEHPAYDKYAKLWLGSGFHVLINKAIELEGIKFYGTPIQPWFNHWGFGVRGSQASQMWYNLIPKDTDVLITHTPPFGILDHEDWHGRYPSRFGCEALRYVVDNLPDLKVHAFGHIHMGYGQRQIGNTIFINAAILNEHYEIQNAPIVIDL